MSVVKISLQKTLGQKLSMNQISYSNWRNKKFKQNYNTQSNIIAYKY